MSLGWIVIPQLDAPSLTCNIEKIEPHSVTEFLPLKGYNPQQIHNKIKTACGMEMITYQMTLL